MTWYGECGYRTILNAVSHWLEGGHWHLLEIVQLRRHFISLLVAARESVCWQVAFNSRVPSLHVGTRNVVITVIHVVKSVHVHVDCDIPLYIKKKKFNLTLPKAVDSTIVRWQTPPVDCA